MNFVWPNVFEQSPHVSPPTRPPSSLADHYLLEITKENTPSKNSKEKVVAGPLPVHSTERAGPAAAR